jgi:hypothetical protein
MGRAYAGILGSLSFAISIARGLAAGSGVEGTLLAASAALFVFGAIGYLAGQLADYLVKESVRVRFQAAMANWEPKHTNDKQQQAKNQPKSNS